MLNIRFSILVSALIGSSIGIDAFIPLHNPTLIGRASVTSSSPFLDHGRFYPTINANQNRPNVEVQQQLHAEMKNKNKDGSNIDVDGLENAPFIFAFIVLVAVWLFSVPSDFRRARFCSDQQIIDNPGSRCTTVNDWTNGIVKYYQNGGSINFDFSVEKEGNVWVGGDNIDYSSPRP